jgi:hypothetical protein
MLASCTGLRPVARMVADVARTRRKVRIYLSHLKCPRGWDQTCEVDVGWLTSVDQIFEIDCADVREAAPGARSYHSPSGVNDRLGSIVLKKSFVIIGES